MRFGRLYRLDTQLSRTMGNCFERRQAGNSSSSSSRWSSSSNEATETAANIVVKQYKPRILCLHGWRTNGDILSMQMAALQANTSMQCVFIDAPFPGRGEPDKGIAFFYPDRPYYEWFYRSKRVETSTDDADATKSTQVKSSAKYENLDESVKFLTDHLDKHGPYDGILGFSQGASMVTRLVQRQEQIGSLPSSTNRTFKFVILIGGVPPQELADNISSGEPLFKIPSLHIMGQIDPLLPESLILESLYAAIPERVTLSHIEGHNIPSIRTNIYPQIENFIVSRGK